MSAPTDPRARPRDPAGTQPKIDPESLQPTAGGATRLALPAAAGAATAELLPEPASTASVPAPPAPVLEYPHAARFQFLFGVLGALGVVAIGLVALLLSAPKSAPEKPWSTWRPASDGLDPAQQIADFVSPRYRLDDGNQIVRVSGGPPVLKGQPLTLGIYRSGQQPARLEGNSVLYQMCGDGSECSIKEGKPSDERGLLLYREGLELALYTFRYVSGVNQVIVTIPPPPPGSVAATGAQAPATAATGTTTATGTTATGSGKTGSSATSTATAPAHHALMFRAQDLASELGRPLNASLSAYTPRVSQMDSSADAALVMQLTAPLVYDFTIDEVPQSGSVMLLSPPGLGG